MSEERGRPAGSGTSRLLVRLAGRMLPLGAPREWPEAMIAEVESIPTGPARVRFALGCLLAAGREQVRASKMPTAVRLVGLSLAAVFVVQAAVEAHQWLNGNAASLRIFLLLMAVVVGLLTTTTLRLAARHGGLAGITLTAGPAAGLAAATLWGVSASSSPAMPRDAGGGIVLIAFSAVLAVGLVGYRTRTLRDGCAAGLLAAAVGTAVVFSIAEATIQAFPGRIPDIVGPVMPAGSTTEQVLRENRIEIIDGYVVLLFLVTGLLATLLATLLVASRTHRPGRQATGA